MADLDNVDPQDVEVPPDADELGDVPVVDPDAEAQVDQDRAEDATPGELADDDPNKSW